MKAALAVALTIVCLACARPAEAQQAGRRPVEINLGGTGVVTWISTGASLRATITFPVNERISIEVLGGPYRGSTDGDVSGDVRAFYGIQIRRDIDRGRRAGVTPFLSFGAAGVVTRERGFDCTPLPCTTRESTSVLPPVILFFGGGVQYAVKPRLAVRVEVQGALALVIPAGAFVSVGLTIPLGHRFTTRASSSPAPRR